MRHMSCKVGFVYRLNMRTCFSFEGGEYVFELYAIEDVMLPILVFFFFWIFTFAKVER